MPLIRVQLTIPTTYNNLGMPSPQPLPQDVDTGWQTEAEYVAYHLSKGIIVNVLSRAPSPPTAQALFVDYAKGIGAGPAGMIAAGVNLVSTNIPGSSTPVTALAPPPGGSDEPTFPQGSPFGKAPAIGAGIVAGTGSPVIGSKPKFSSKQLAVVALAIIGYFAFWK